MRRPSWLRLSTEAPGRGDARGGTPGTDGIPNPPLPPPLPKGPIPHRKEFPDWRRLTRASAAWANRRPGRRGRVLIATNIGGHDALTMLESTLAAALAVRDADVEIVLCDGILPGCLQAEYSAKLPSGVLIGRKLPETICRPCFSRGRAMFEPLGLKVYYLGELVTAAEREAARSTAAALPLEAIAGYAEARLQIGHHARAGALRYFAKGDLSDEPEAAGVLRRYFEASLASVSAYRRLFAAQAYDVAVFHHGLYVPQGAVGEVARDLGVRVVNWVTAYRASCFIFSHGDTYHHTLMQEPTAEWRDMRWGARQRMEIDAYLDSRRHGNRDWIGFHERPTEDMDTYARAAGLDLTRPIVGMLTNVVWDAQLHYPSNAFASQTEWVAETIRHFAGRPDLQLMIRIHPAEIRGTLRSRQPMLGEIAKRFPSLPRNVFVIPPDSDVSTYAAMALCDCALIYGTKMGVELAAVGIPVVVAGEAWIKNKGLTLDAETPARYFDILDRLPLREPLAADVVEQAKKYAYHFFFRRMMPLTFMRRAASAQFFKTDIGSVDEIAAGRDASLDRICDGILHGTPFIYPAEELGVHDA